MQIAEKMLHRLRSSVGRAARAGRLWLGAGRAAVPSESLNDASSWEQIYDLPIVPVTALASPVARAIADQTSPGDVLLETGCGSASASAELASGGRIIELCDFSPKILERAKQLFHASGLPEPRTTVCDITQPLPWPDRAVDVVWSSGVLEHWTDEELRPILREMARVARKRVVSLVPFAGCLLYRLGKDLAEKRGRWPYGRELPRETLRPLFEELGLRDVREHTVWTDAAPNVISLTKEVPVKIIRDWWLSLPADDPVKHRQGYLLVTVGTVGA